jgi:predicted secreted Zn-dependent protease
MFRSTALSPVLAVPIALIVTGFTDVTAHAGVKVSEKFETYRISGDSGEALMGAMDRGGPRHGFLARAIAQTRYSVAWDIGYKADDDKVCKVTTANVKLSVSYRFPELAGKPSASMKRSWAKFMTGVRKHERMHGRIARQMAASAQKAVSSVSVANDNNCRKAKREVTRVVKAAYDVYEARQARFDAIEHQPGGTVDRLVTAFIRRR